jgi:hypothetical protein
MKSGFENGEGQGLCSLHSQLLLLSLFSPCENRQDATSLQNESPQTVIDNGTG